MVGEQKWLGSGCFMHYESDPLALCHYGPESGYTRRLLIAGDSHLGQFIEIYGYLQHQSDPRLSACDLDRAKAMPFDGSREAAAQLSNVKVIDLTDFYCDDTKCPAVIGNVIVYRDDNHITRTWAKTLAPHLNRAIVAALEEYDAQTDKP